jgi:uncharacterized protein DUF4184
MPFTLAHPAAALPLRSRLRSLGCASALAVGSMVPDLPYFLPLGIDGPESHSAAGILWFGLPAGLAAWLVYVFLVRPFALALLPVSILRRLDAPSSRPVVSRRALAAVAVSAVVGATTHVVWDSFTHASGAGVDIFPVLRTPVRLFDGYAPEVFTLLQHASSLAGLALLAVWAVRWYRRTTPTGTPTATPLPLSLRTLAAAAVVLPTAATALLVLWWRLPDDGDGDLRIFQQSVGQAIFSAGTVFLVMVMLTALACMVGRPTRAVPGVDSEGGRA